MKPEIKSKVNEVVLFYNRYRSPESTATLIKIDDRSIHIKFTGPFTSTCGINDWVEDFRYLAEDLCLKLSWLRSGKMKNLTIGSVYSRLLRRANLPQSLEVWRPAHLSRKLLPLPPAPQA